MSHRIAVSILITPDRASEQLLLVERNPELRFFGGYYAFPGGTLDPEDETIEVRHLDREELAPFVAAAARELLEEVGVWMARGPRPDQSRLRELRRRLIEERQDFGALLGELGAHLDARDFEAVGRITTPPFAPRRYDTWFLHCRLRPEDRVEIWPGELVGGDFFPASTALEQWRRGEIPIVPPVLIFLQELAGRDIGSGLASLREMIGSYRRGRLHPVRFSPGILLAPLQARTKPPATHTNAYLVGDKRLWLVDPAASNLPEKDRLWELLDGLLSEGRELEGLLLTHAHPDHVGAVAAAQARYGVPLLAHEATRTRLPAGARLDRTIGEGDVLELGTAPDGSPDWRLEVFALPGHSPDHLAFRESRYGAVLAGDLVSTLSSVLIEPGDGDLVSYMASLARLSELCRGLLYPGHGPPARDGARVVAAQIAHRKDREQQLVAALAEAPRTPREIVESVYTDVDPRLWPLAERSVLAGLAKLEHEGRARRTPAGYRLVR